MNSLDYVLVALKLKYGQSLLAMQMQKGLISCMMMIVTGTANEMQWAIKNDFILN